MNDNIEDFKKETIASLEHAIRVDSIKLEEMERALTRYLSEKSDLEVKIQRNQERIQFIKGDK